MEKPLKVAFLVDNVEVSSLVFELVDHISKNDHFDDPIIISGYLKEEARKPILSRLAYRLKEHGIKKTVRTLIFSRLYKLIERIELPNTLLARPEYRKNEYLDSLHGLRFVSVEGVWSASGLFLSFTKSDIEKLSSNHIDVMIRCGSGILKGDVLNVSEFGILSFHHGDNRINRGGPSGFWEVLNNEPSSGFIIQKLGGELDGGSVVFRGNIMTPYTWLSNHANLLAKSNVFMIRLLDQLAHTRRLPEPDHPSLHDRPLYKLDSNPLLLLKYLARIHGPRIFRRSKRILSRQKKVNRWSVAYAEFDGYKKSLWRYKEIKNPPQRFLADPFVYTKNEQSVIFVEDFYYSDNRARISAIDVTNGKDEFLGTVLEEDFHLSFPFIFDDGDTIYMIPESYQKNEIRLYQCIEFPKRWKLIKVLMSGVSAADTMMLKQNNKWFMLTNICSANIDDHQSELHIFHSDKLLTSNWNPISQGNPVIFDSTKARNGGLFFDNGKIYRINQIHTRGHYGHSYGINLIKTLDESTYEEIGVDQVDPLFKKHIHSTHHFHSDCHYSVTDFCRFAPLD